MMARKLWPALAGLGLLLVGCAGLTVCVAGAAIWTTAGRAESQTGVSTALTQFSYAPILPKQWMTPTSSPAPQGTALALAASTPEGTPLAAASATPEAQLTPTPPGNVATPSPSPTPPGETQASVLATPATPTLASSPQTPTGTRPPSVTPLAPAASATPTQATVVVSTPLRSSTPVTNSTQVIGNTPVGTNTPTRANTPVPPPSLTPTSAATTVATIPDGEWEYYVSDDLGGSTYIDLQIDASDAPSGLITIIAAIYGDENITCRVFFSAVTVYLENGVRKFSEADSAGLVSGSFRSDDEISLRVQDNLCPTDASGVLTRVR
jgi:hypothetical protein